MGNNLPLNAKYSLMHFVNHSKIDDEDVFNDGVMLEVHNEKTGERIGIINTREEFRVKQNQWYTGCIMDANAVIEKMNKKMSDKKSDVCFYWSGTHLSPPNPTGYFILWGYRQSHFTYSNHEPIKSTFLFKGMPGMLDDIIEREGELEKYEQYVLNACQHLVFE